MLDFELKEGMVFENSWEVGDFIHCDWAKVPQTIYKALAHYCEFHKDRKHKIYIDKVFEVPKPFLRTDFAYEIGEIIESKFGRYKIIDRYLKKRQPTNKNRTRLYLCECLIDGSQFEYNASEIARGCNCPVCWNRKFVAGESLYDKRPDLHVYIKNIEDAKKYAETSGKKIICRCPECGNEKPMIIENLSRNGFHCTVCGDGVSYPNKFINNLLDQLNVKHEAEKTFDWLPNKRYDQYIPEHFLIIENQGEQHYIGNSNKQFPHYTLEKQQENDEYKKRFAINNGIKNYIYIDCSESSQEWIKNSVMNSKLPTLLNFNENDIDWSLCNKVACTSLTRQVWDLFNSYMSTADISKKLGISTGTVRNYINRGVECGKCEPLLGASKETRKARKAALDYTNGQMKPIYCVTDNVYFASRFECEEYYSDLFPKTGAYQLYRNITKNIPYKGKTFVYITKQEFNDKLSKSSEDKTIKIFGRPYLSA